MKTLALLNLEARIRDRLERGVDVEGDPLDPDHIRELEKALEEIASTLDTRRTR